MTIEIEAIQLKLGNLVDGEDTVVARAQCLVDGIGELMIFRLRSENGDDTIDSYMAVEPTWLISVKKEGLIAYVNPELEQLMARDPKPLEYSSHEEV